MPKRHALSRDDTQAIKFTGGTTGIPKGVMQPYRAWVAGIINQIHGWQITQQDKFVICAPISNGTGTYVKIGRAHVGNPVTNAHLVCRLLLEKKKQQTTYHTYKALLITCIMSTITTTSSY